MGWKFVKRRLETKPLGPPKPAPYIAGKCPACGGNIVWQITADGKVVPCEPKRRLVIFTYREDENGLPLDEEKPIVLFTERTGRLVIGREAWAPEIRRFKNSGNPGRPFTIGREAHLDKCERLDRWVSGEAVPPSIDMLGGS